jgi:hypothetical protein
MRGSPIPGFSVQFSGGEQCILACFRRQFQLKKNPVVRHSTIPKYNEEKHFWTELLGERAWEAGLGAMLARFISVRGPRKEAADSVPGSSVVPG